MILFYTASQDATIYLQQPYQNTGIDEMLELSKVYYGGTPDMSRVLIQFDTTEISKSIANRTIPSGSFTASLQLKITKADEIAARFNVEAYPISQSWENGTGTRFDNITTIIGTLILIFFIVKIMSKKPNVSLSNTIQ
jgi:hypothetical protein